MIISHYSPGEIVFGKWKLDRLLGAGSYGKVYEVTRNDFGSYKAAIKIITIPQSPGEVMEARSEGMDDHSITLYFRSMVDEIVREFELLSQFKGTSNIVSYEDHDVIPHDDGYGWDILIRMELLTPLMQYMQDNPMDTQDVIRLGVDICKALELCHHYNVIHRDIKPENIFVSKMGDFKLGDFGIARTVEKTGSGLSKKGTYTYMAPEVFREARYDATVDIYSLGIVLYRLLNNNRAPFLPAPPAPITHADREMSLSRRICGDPLPAPQNADPRLAQVILKVCAYHPAERYQSASQMRADLEALMNSVCKIIPPVVEDSDHTVILPKANTVNSDADAVSNVKDDPNHTVILRNVSTDDPSRTVILRNASTDDSNRTVILHEANTDASVPPVVKKKKKRGLVALVIGLVAILAILAVVLLSTPGSNVPNSTPGTTTPGVSGNQETGEASEDDLPDSGDLFEAMLWGSYDVEGTYVPKEGEPGEYTQDLTEFAEKVKYQTFEDLEVSCLPYSFGAYSLRHNADFYGDELISYDDPEDMEILKELVMAEYGSEYWVNFNQYLDLNLIDLWVCDKNACTYGSTFAYRLEGNKLILSNIEVTDESTFAFTLTDYTSCKMAVDGQNIILSAGGRKFTYQPDYLSGSRGDSLETLYAGGYIYDDALAYRDIAHISVSGDPAINPDDARTYVTFTDGHNAVDPTHSFNEDGTLTIRWTQRWQEYNGYTEKVDDPYEFTCEYMAGMGGMNTTGGLLLKIDGKWYRYQNSREAYLAKKLQGVDTESLSDEQVTDIISTKDNMLDELGAAFTDAGITATIDSNTGKVNMDASILFATSDYSLSDAGKAYLDGFLDVYTAIILGENYAGYVSEIIIEGHTDTEGTYDYNQVLSENRAASVASYCTQRNPELESIITTKGYSFDQPIYKEDGSVDMDASRRVTFSFVLTPLEG